MSIRRTIRTRGAALASGAVARRSVLTGVVIVIVVALGAAASVLVGGATPASAQAATTSCPTSNPPDELTLAGGTPQTAKLDAGFSAPLQVTLAASNGCPVTTSVAGTPITFSAPVGGATGVFSASGSSSVTVGADASGSASAPAFSANDVAGSYTVTASSSYGSVTFALTNTAAGTGSSISAQAPTSQSATIGDHFGAPLQALVLDANGNPVEDATVTFSLGAGAGGSGATAAPGASFDGGSTQATETTNASGVATSPLLTANTVAGTFTATAATAGVIEPASFRLDNLAGASPRVRLVAAARSATVGSRYSRPLEVEVLDADGAPAQGTAVTFSLGASGTGGAGGSAGTAGASFLDGSTQATETTGVRGRATSPLFAADAIAGTFTVTVSVPGVTNPLTITLDNLAGKSPTIRLVGAGHKTATVGAPYRQPLEVKVLTPAGKPDQGATVTFSLGASAGAGGANASGAGAGASFLDGSAQATETTDASGVAVSPRFSANDTSGTFTATASVAGVRNPAMFTLDNLAGRSPSLTQVDGRARTARVDDGYRAPLEVRLRAADGKPVEGATVTFSLGASGSGGAGASSGAGATFVAGSAQATATTNAAGVAVSPTFTANGTAGAFTATATTPATAKAAVFSLRNLAGKPTTLAAGAAASEQTVPAARFPIGLAVTVKDKEGNPVPDVVVTFTAPARGATGTFARPHHGRSHTVRVRTNSAGIAVAPAFTAGGTSGGYVVKATVKDASPAAFALVNEPGAAT